MPDFSEVDSLNKDNKQRSQKISDELRDPLFSDGQVLLATSVHSMCSFIHSFIYSLVDLLNKCI